MLAPENPNDLLYCQGYALSPNTKTYPLQHAWFYIDNQVIDVTWNELSLCYFGIPFNRKWIIEKTEEKQINNEPKINFLNYESPLSIKVLQHGLPNEALLNC